MKQARKRTKAARRRSPPWSRGGCLNAAATVRSPVVRTAIPFRLTNGLPWNFSGGHTLYRPQSWKSVLARRSSAGSKLSTQKNAHRAFLAAGGPAHPLDAVKNALWRAAAHDCRRVGRVAGDVARRSVRR